MKIQVNKAELMHLVSDWYDRVAESQRSSKLVLACDIGRKSGSPGDPSDPSAGKVIIRVAEETNLGFYAAA